jgi:hypothetical protein
MIRHVMVAQAATGSNTIDSLSSFTDALAKVNKDPEAVPMALNTLWTIAMRGNLYGIVASIGVLIASLGVGFWCVKFFLALKEGDLKPAANEMIIAVILVMLLHSGGQNMRALTLGTRDIMNSINQSVGTVISNEVDFRSAIRVLGTTNAAVAVVDSLYSKCQAQEFDKLQKCVAAQSAVANATIDLLNGKIDSAKTGNNADWQKQIKEWQNYTKQYSNNRFSSAAIGETLSDSQAAVKGIADVGKKGSAVAFDDTLALRRIILSFRGAFLYIIEVIMLVTGLLGPFFVALSMFPVGAKPLIAWGTSFLTLGFCKICFSLISGLSAVAMVYSGPENVDMLVAAVVLGLLAPVLAFSVASGAGIGAINSVGLVGQSFGMNPGVGYFTLGLGGQLPINKPNPTPTPATNKNTDYD